MVSLPQLSKELPCSTTNVGAAKIFAKVMHKLSDDMYCWLIFSTTIYYGAYDSKVLYHLDSFLRVVIFLHGLLFFKIRISTLFLLFCPIHKCFLVDTRSGFSVLWKGEDKPGCVKCVYLWQFEKCARTEVAVSHGADKGQFMYLIHLFTFLHKKKNILHSSHSTALLPGCCQGTKHCLKHAGCRVQGQSILSSAPSGA